MRKPWHEYFLDLADMASTRSTCPRLSVGCVIVDPAKHRVISTGYNGSPSGQPHCEDVGCHIVGGHCKRAVHAECNALSALEYTSSELIAFVTHKPCRLCRDLFARYNVLDIRWRHEYGNDPTEV